MTLSKPELTQIAIFYTDLVSELVLKDNIDLFNEVEQYKKYLLSNKEEIKELGSYLDKLKNLEIELRELTEKYKIIKEDVITLLENIDGKQYAFRDMYVSKAVFNSYIVNNYINEVLTDKIKERFGSIYLDRPKVFNKIKEAIKKLAKEYPESQKAKFLNILEHKIKNDIKDELIKQITTSDNK